MDAGCTVTATAGAVRIVGTDGDDVICVPDRDDRRAFHVIDAKGGDDIVVLGGAGVDLVYGGADDLDGNTQDDVLWGGAGDDDLDGRGHDDQLDGGPGDDTLRGGAADDRIWGGSGDDDLDCGNGVDHLDGGADTDACTRGDTTTRCETEGRRP